MKTAAEWLAEGTADRPDDFAIEELKDALAWIARIQADARVELLERITRLEKLRATVKALLNEPASGQRLVELTSAFLDTAAR